MKIGILQSNPVTGALDHNTANLFAGVEAAAVQGATLCVAPEMALCGPNAGDLLVRSDFLVSCREALDGLAQCLSGADLPPLLLGAPVKNHDPADRALRNGAALLHDGKVSIVGIKSSLSHEPLLHEERYFTTGEGCSTFLFGGWNILVTIGDDAGHLGAHPGSGTSSLDKALEAGNIDCIINIGAVPYAREVPVKYFRAVKDITMQYRVPVITANMAGGNDSLVFFGNSLAFNGLGICLAQGLLFEEQTLVVDLASLETPSFSPPLVHEATLWKALVTGTRDFVTKCGFTRVVIGLSGGVDSALVAAIAAEALGCDNVTGVLMPSFYSSQGSVDDSLALADNLAIATHTIPISSVLESYQALFAPVFEKGLHGLAEENIQARIRAAILMAYAGERASLVLNTGNKSEAAVGYTTLYGDQIGALSVIGDLYKEEVFSLCRWRNSEGHVIPDCILEKAPSAELRPDQKDSDSLPPYPVLDAILRQFIDEGKSLEALIAEGFDPIVVRQVLALACKTHFKRKQGPLCLRVSTSSLWSLDNIPVAFRAKNMP